VAKKSIEREEIVEWSGQSCKWLYVGSLCTWFCDRNMFGGLYGSLAAGPGTLANEITLVLGLTDIVMLTAHVARELGSSIEDVEMVI